MKYINKIEINYFRSIHRIIIRDLSDVNIFTGMNDVGKSNVLKALNLFFNNETESGIQFNFFDDFNFKRLLEVRQESVKGKQFIQIKITFNRGNFYEKTLPERFTVTKIWYRDSETPLVTDNIERQLQNENKKYNDKSKSSLTRFLKKIKYYYIPAIKDEQIFQKVLSELSNTIYNTTLLNDQDINNSLNSLYEKVSSSSESLNQEYFKATKIKAILASPKNVSELFRTLNIDTKLEENTIKLDKRGDGIRVRYLPSILNYIAKNSNQICIWGFEEPENSLEFNFAYKMAESFINDYSKNSEILLTTHSPAFISFKDKNNVQLFRCFNSDGTKILLDKEANELPEISEELGYSVLMQEYYDRYINERKIRIENNESLEKLKLEIEKSRKPVILTEGKTDVAILKTAWEKLYNVECPFEIKSCDVYSDGHEYTAAGCDMLVHTLKTCRFDNNHKIIGLFDRDEEGLKSYKLDRNFVEKENRYKCHRNNMSFAFILPIPENRGIFADLNTLCIEYFFSEEDMKKEKDNKGLKFIYLPEETKVGGKVINRQDVKKFEYSKIDNNTKTFFAEYIVPDLPKESFNNFKLIFDEINYIMEKENFFSMAEV